MIILNKNQSNYKSPIIYIMLNWIIFCCLAFINKTKLPTNIKFSLSAFQISLSHPAIKPLFVVLKVIQI